MCCSVSTSQAPTAACVVACISPELGAFCFLHASARNVDGRRQRFRLTNRQPLLMDWEWQRQR
ncbi:hypothetical protein BAUCODRAFT_39266 [Baudoinia panamericana UAMH 10762]|uniref:Uncharacterized protein n=1 Tax=Baudoinia panamericana (strain UAMH 10762) TaxID=717646 RepID=M2LBC3_BAUPA|nr:uncharacterized protein BAUCODRAFT_39266 [Baudoinia panamericana UAMH 10762]EMC91127.1 hypothetical protein BAUCODRAFT_39266 [Baudoinia panamericana UAMH 10762]